MGKSIPEFEINDTPDVTLSWKSPTLTATATTSVSADVSPFEQTRQPRKRLGHEKRVADFVFKGAVLLVVSFSL